MTATLQYRPARQSRNDPSIHIFAVGQAVRMKGGIANFTPPEDIYQITATLPPRGTSPQYRIRNDEERYERVTTQDSIELVQAATPSDDATLLEKTFGSQKSKA